jgi:hypothetical protein
MSIRFWHSTAQAIVAGMSVAGLDPLLTPLCERTVCGGEPTTKPLP